VEKRKKRKWGGGGGGGGGGGECVSNICFKFTEFEKKNHTISDRNTSYTKFVVLNKI